MKSYLPRTGLLGFTLSLSCAFSALALCSFSATSLAQGLLPAKTHSDGSTTRFDFSEVGNSSHGTVNVGVALSEGIVLAADSRLTLITKATFPGYMVLSDNNSKLFTVSNFGVSTYGEAFLQGRSISSLVSDYSIKFGKNTDDVDGFAKRFSDYMSGIYDSQFKEESKPILGFVIAGYDSKGIGKLISVEFPTSRTSTVIKNTNTTQGAQWFGDTETITRVVKGWDSQLASIPVWNNLSEDNKKQVSDGLGKLEYNIPWNALMLQDGVDFATSLVKMTITFQRFSYGTVGNAGAIPSVGGAVDVLVVKPTGVEWVKQKALVTN